MFYQISSRPWAFWFQGDSVNGDYLGLWGFIDCSIVNVKGSTNCMGLYITDTGEVRRQFVFDKVLSRSPFYVTYLNVCQTNDRNSPSRDHMSIQPMVR